MQDFRMLSECWSSHVRVYLMVLMCFYCVASTEPGTVSRNCTEYGWSDTFPHYVDACLEGNGSHVVGTLWRQIPDFSFRCFGWLNLFLCLSGHVLRVGEGSVHGGLQHLSGLPHHRHGYPVQVQVRWSSPNWVSEEFQRSDRIKATPQLMSCLSTITTSSSSQFLSSETEQTSMFGSC